MQTRAGEKAGGTISQNPPVTQRKTQNRTASATWTEEIFIQVRCVLEMQGFLQHGKGVLVWYAAFANHCSLFPTAAVIEEFKNELKGFSLSKGTIQFLTNKPLPVPLIKKIVKARVKQVEKQEA